MKIAENPYAWTKEIAQGTKAAPGGPAPESTRSFADTLKDAVNKVNELHMEADTAVTDLAVGNTRSVHQALLALEKASVSFQLLAQVKNKVVDAYREIMRMTV